ncbi:uncharacterized protein [Clytia hemisphaerica]|uniref:uncharacterized protein n=1 Tax=Clytia hemisphaerica TaxID=252671 RepID=UPI0034D61CF3
MRAKWTAQILLGRKDWKPGNYSYVCSNHFVDGKPTIENPIPTLFLKGPTEAETPTQKSRKPPAKRKIPFSDKGSYEENDEPPTSRAQLEFQEDEITSSVDEGTRTKNPNVSVQTESWCYVPMVFEHMTREYDVRFYTGFEDPKMFATVFDFVKLKASVMTYWDGTKRTNLARVSSELETHMASSEYNIVPIKSRPFKKIDIAAGIPYHNDAS